MSSPVLRITPTCQISSLHTPYSSAIIWISRVVCSILPEREERPCADKIGKTESRSKNRIEGDLPINRLRLGIAIDRFQLRWALLHLSFWYPRSFFAPQIELSNETTHPGLLLSKFWLTRETSSASGCKQHSRFVHVITKANKCQPSRASEAHPSFLSSSLVKFDGSHFLLSMTSRRT